MVIAKKDARKNRRRCHSSEEVLWTIVNATLKLKKKLQKIRNVGCRPYQTVLYVSNIIFFGSAYPF
jgi:hypothetical protein